MLETIRARRVISSVRTAVDRVRALDGTNVDTDGQQDQVKVNFRQAVQGKLHEFQASGQFAKDGCSVEATDAQRWYVQPRDDEARVHSTFCRTYSYHQSQDRACYEMHEFKSFFGLLGGSGHNRSWRVEENLKTGALTLTEHCGPAVGSWRGREGLLAQTSPRQWISFYTIHAEPYKEPMRYETVNGRILTGWIDPSCRPPQ